MLGRRLQPGQCKRLRSGLNVIQFTFRLIFSASGGDLPVQLPTKFEMAVNLKTAKALGLTVPQSMRLLADEVIE